MMGLSILLFLIAVTLNNHSETINVDVLAFTANVLAIFSALFMAVGVSLAILNAMRRKPHNRGHNFETGPHRIRRSG